VWEYSKLLVCQKTLVSFLGMRTVDERQLDKYAGIFLGGAICMKLFR